MEFKTTVEIKVPERLIDQVIGQDKAVDIIKKAAKQKRHVLLIGSPGTGKSMLAQAMAELMEREELEDVLAYHNENNENQPRIRIVKTYPDYNHIKQSGLEKYYTQAELEKTKKIKKEELSDLLKTGSGRRIANFRQEQDEKTISPIFVTIILGIILAYIIFGTTLAENIKWLILASVLGFGILYAISNATVGIGKRLAPREGNYGPKLLIDNAERKTAPFIDATGSRAGSLLGDVKHDPLQSFFPTSVVYKIQNGQLEIVTMQDLVDSLLSKYPNLIEKDEKYEGLVLPKDEEVYTLGLKNSQIANVKILCVNRRHHNGKMKTVDQNNNRLILTSEHRVYINGRYVAASCLDGKENLIRHEEPIITALDIIKTFSLEDQISALNYQRFLNIKNSNPSFGYKKIAKILDIASSQIRWWNNGTNKPNAIRTTERLERLGLLPLYTTNPSMPAIARVLGATFGDGGIFSNLNAIFLSSSESDSLDVYGQDLISIFGEDICKNFERRTSGINNTGRCIWNINREVVRFFIALGAPVGRKNKALFIPSWIQKHKVLQQEFFGALLGNELCSPRFSATDNKIQCFCLALAGTYSLKQNRISLLNKIAHYLNSYGIKTTEKINENEFRPGRYTWRLSIFCEIENVLRFYKLIPVRYSNAKLMRIKEAIENTLERKNQKIDELIKLRKTLRYATSTLRVSDSTMQKIIAKEDFTFEESDVEFLGMVYNITTESENIIANDILVANSGGLGTPSHLRVEPGAIHQANKGVLFIDEIASLKLNWQQEILTAMQEKEYSITGQSEMSSGALVKTQPVPSEFVLVAAGNLPDMNNIHPALRSRIRGEGYEVYMEDSTEDTPENQEKLMRFVAQEIKKDNKIPHFAHEAVLEVIEEARKMAGRRKKLTLNLRELGGLIRAAGDIANERKLPNVTRQEVIDAKKIFRSIESQVSAKIVEQKKEYQTIINVGSSIGRVNGLAVLGDTRAGLVLPIVAEATPAASKSEGRVIATGKLGTIAKEAVENVSATFKKYIGDDISKTDLHIQFLQTYEGVEGDSASISIAVAVISALSEIAVLQDTAMTGSLDVRGNVLPVGGVTAKIEAAIEAGVKKALIPKANAEDVYLAKDKVGKIQIVHVGSIVEVLENALEEGKKKKELIKKISAQTNR